MKVTYRGDRDAAMEAQVVDWAAELDSVYDRISRCDVVVESLSAAERPDRRYRVRLAIVVPGGEIVVGRDPVPGPIQEDARAAVRASFEVARRRLEQYVSRNLRDDRVPPGSPARIG
jgi:hypothetical protein